MNNISKIIAFTICLVFINACSSFNQSKSIYKELNGMAGIHSIVDSFVYLVAKDPDIFPYFAKASVTHFKEGFSTHLCYVSGGPCAYEGDSMVDIHTGMQINEAHFNKVVEILISAMQKNDIDYQTQNRLLAKLAPFRKDVIKI